MISCILSVSLSLYLSVFSLSLSLSPLNHQQDQTSKEYQHPQFFFLPLGNSSFLTFHISPHSINNHWSAVMYTNLICLKIHRNGIEGVCIVLAPFFQYNYFEIQPYCCMYHWHILCHYWIGRPQFIIHWTFGSSPSFSTT